MNTPLPSSREQVIQDTQFFAEKAQQVVEAAVFAGAVAVFGALIAAHDAVKAPFAEKAQAFVHGFAETRQALANHQD